MLFPTHLRDRRHVIFDNDRVLVAFNTDRPFPTKTSTGSLQQNVKSRGLTRPVLASNSEPYLCAAPLIPYYAGAVIGGLSFSKNRVPIVKEGAQFRLDPTIASRWMVVEKILTDLALALLRSGDTPYIPIDYKFPPSPRLSGYSEGFPSKVAARSAVRNSRDAFNPLIAHVTWAVITHRYMYRARNPNAEPKKLDEGWSDVLRNKYHVEPAWIEDLKLTCTCDFKVSRVGLIVENPTEWAFSDRIPALVEANIPVWLIWNDLSAEKNKLSWPSDLRPLGPTAMEVQSAREKAILTQDDLHQTALFIDNMDDDESGSSEELIPDFQQWLKSKQVFISAAFMRGSDNQRRRWSQIEASAEKIGCPAKKGATVYEWTRSDGGGYIRERVNRSSVEDVWKSYGEKQRWFNCIAEEWELCVDLDPTDVPIDAGSESSDDDGPGAQYDTLYNMEERRADDNAAHVRLYVHPDSQTAAVLEVDDSTVDLTQIGDCVPTIPDIPDEGGLGFDAFSLMSIRFGFSFASGTLYWASQKKPLKLEKALKIIGDSHRAPLLNFPTGLEAGFVQYVMQLVELGQDSTNSITVSDALCDMLSSNHRFLAHFTSTIRAKRAFVEDKPLYFLDHMHDTDRDWHLAVWDPCAALQALRSNPASLNELVTSLVESRTPFLTLRELREAHVGPQQNTFKRTKSGMFWASTRLGLGIRPPGHVLGISDYKAYEITRNRLLENKRVARAAIKRGGILSRLTTTTVDGLVVLDGPSREDTPKDDRVVLNVLIDDNLRIMYDDNISEQELTTVVGLYNIYGMGIHDDLHAMVP